MYIHTHTRAQSGGKDVGMSLVRALYGLAVHYDPLNVPLLNNLGSLLAQLGEFEPALVSTPPFPGARARVFSSLSHSLRPQSLSMSRTWSLCLPQCVAVCCSVLQCVAVYCSVLQCVAVCCSVLQCVAVCCSVLQCVAVGCSVLQCVAYGMV